jgi:hypothetical protein
MRIGIGCSLQELNVQMGVCRPIITDRADLLTLHDIRAGGQSRIDAIEMQVGEIHQSVMGVVDLENNVARTVSVLSLFPGEAYRSPAHGINLRALFGREVDAIVEVPPVCVDARPE